MSGQTATVEAATEISSQRAEASAAPPPPPPAAPAGETDAQPEVTLQDVLVEDVSIDGMCGVY